MTIPYSASSPRIWFTCAVRALTNPWRARCSANTACCSPFLIGTTRIVGRLTASQIFGIHHIILVRLLVGLHELRGHQLHRMPERLQLPRPVVGAATGF